MKSIVYLSLFLLICSSRAFCSPLFDLERLKNAIQENDRNLSVELLEQSKRNMVDEEVSSFILELWDVQCVDCFVARDIIRANIADFLSQAAFNNLIEINREAILDYARVVVLHDDRNVVSKALSILARDGNESDFKTIFKIAEANAGSRSSYLFRVSALAIIENCDVGQIDLLSKSNKLNKDQKLFVLNTFNDFKDGSYCKKKMKK